MTVYDTRQRCPYCRQFDLPCNDAVHGNPLFPYLEGIGNLAVPYVPGQNEPRPAAPPPAARDRAARARALSTVALICIMLSAALVAIGLVAAILWTGGEPCTAAFCRPVDLASLPPTKPWQ